MQWMAFYRKTYTVCINIKKFFVTFWVTFLKTNKFVLQVCTWKCILFLTVRCSLYMQVAEEYLSPIQIKHATFIFITGRWQLFTQDAELIRKPVLLRGGINKNCEDRIHHINEDGQILKGHRQSKLSSRWQPCGAERIYSGCVFLFLFYIHLTQLVMPFILTILLELVVCWTEHATCRRS